MIPFNKTSKQWLPFAVLVIGGWLITKEFAKIRYKYPKNQYINVREEAKAMGIKIKEPVSLEEEYENTMKKVDLDNWENIRIPRPWEETDAKQ